MVILELDFQNVAFDTKKEDSEKRLQMAGRGWPFGPFPGVRFLGAWPVQSS